MVSNARDNYSITRVVVEKALTSCGCASGPLNCTGAKLRSWELLGSVHAMIAARDVAGEPKEPVTHPSPQATVRGISVGVTRGLPREVANAFCRTVTPGRACSFMH